jgi:PAS domain-containing protein
MLSGAPLQRPGDPPTVESPQTSARGVLEQCPVPVIAVADDGAVVLANTAVAHFLGYTCDAIPPFSYEDICSFLPADETLFAATRLGAHTFGSLLQLGQTRLSVKMRSWAIAAGADAGAITRGGGLMESLSRRGHREVPSPVRVRSAKAPDNSHEQRSHSTSVAPRPRLGGGGATPGVKQSAPGPPPPHPITSAWHRGPSPRAAGSETILGLPRVNCYAGTGRLTPLGGPNYN